MINEMRQGFETAYIDGSVVSNAAYTKRMWIWGCDVVEESVK